MVEKRKHITKGLYLDLAFPRTIHHAEKCPVCNGSGKINLEKCHGCFGRGWVIV
jgi:DnaJ-class molecular chaperone